MSELERLLTTQTLKMLAHRAKERAASLRKESRGYWHSDRERCFFLKKESARFQDLAQAFLEMQQPYSPRFPALDSPTTTKKEQKP